MVLFLTFTGLGHRYGRRMSILVGDVFVIVGGVIQAASYCSASHPLKVELRADAAQLSRK